MNWLLTGEEIFIDETMTNANSSEATKKIKKYEKELYKKLKEKYPRRDDPIFQGLSISSITNPWNALPKP